MTWRLTYRPPPAGVSDGRRTIDNHRVRMPVVNHRRFQRQLNLIQLVGDARPIPLATLITLAGTAQPGRSPAGWATPIQDQGDNGRLLTQNP